MIRKFNICEKRKTDKCLILLQYKRPSLISFIIANRDETEFIGSFATFMHIRKISYMQHRCWHGDYSNLQYYDCASFVSNKKHIYTYNI